MIIFNGEQLAQDKEEQLKEKVQSLDTQLKIVAILFTEDAGSRLYTRLKSEAAQRVGIEYVVDQVSMKDDSRQLQSKITQYNQDPTITGIIIQKPARSTWLSVLQSNDKTAFNTWWRSLTTTINPQKDVDGLHPSTLTSIKQQTRQSEGKVLPATVQAVLTILERVPDVVERKKVIVLGKSDILGLPLSAELQNKGFQVENIGSLQLKKRVEQGQNLFDAEIIVSATGRKNLISAELVSQGVVVIDVGEPKPDVDFESVKEKASFITPVPGGVGPLTVISLLENCVRLEEFKMQKS